MKRIVIIGASSGIGHRVAADFARMGFKVGIAARREELLHELRRAYPDNIVSSSIDVTAGDAQARLLDLIDRLGGMDTLLLASGQGHINPALDTDTDLSTVAVNVSGFIRIIDTAYRYFRQHSTKATPGQIAVISSVAGTKGIGISASYSASKRFDSTYIDALEQLAHQQHVHILFTDIRPGFIRTDFLAGTKPFAMEMTLDYAAPRIESAILKCKRVAVIDSRWRVLVSLWRLLPQWLWRRISLEVNH